MPQCSPTILQATPNSIRNLGLDRGGARQIGRRRGNREDRTQPMGSSNRACPEEKCNFVLVTGTSDNDHLHNLNTMVEQLQHNGFSLKKDKCTFLQDAVEYLGHKIDAEGRHTLPGKIVAVRSAPEPRNVAKLRSFLGMLNYYAKFIPNLSTLVHPLNALLQRSKQWKWSTNCARAFKLNMPCCQPQFWFTMTLPYLGDASAYGIGAIISHILPDGSEKPIAFASRSLSPSEQNYAQIEKEALSLIYGVKKFHQYLYGRKFQLITDTSLFSQSWVLRRAFPLWLQLGYNGGLLYFPLNIMKSGNLLYFPLNIMKSTSEPLKTQMTLQVEAEPLESVISHRLRHYPSPPLKLGQQPGKIRS